MNESYLSNPNLKAVGVPVAFTQEQIEEYQRCASDCVYFIEHYVKIVHVDRGLIPFEPFEFQKEIINFFVRENKLIVRLSRQSGKTTTTAAFFLWYILFHDNKVCAILANKAATAREILSRIKLAYEHLPLWLQQGVVEWNKGSITLENGSRVLAAATSSSGIRGYSLSLVFLDEFAHVHSNIAEDFFTSIFPTISSGKDTKILIASTPNGMNHFYKFWVDAEEKRNGFVPVFFPWDSHPDRDHEWMEKQLQTLGDIKFRQEILCVGGDTTITVRNKVTGIIETLSIEELYRRLANTLTYNNMDHLVLNTDYDILTPTGFEPFRGLLKTEHKNSLRLIFKGIPDLVCAPNHRLLCGTKFVHAQDIPIGTTIQGFVLIDKRHEENPISLYDPVDVGQHSQYITNELISHNCDFLGSSDTLISGSALAKLVYHVPLRKEQHLDIYEDPIERHTYVITCDVSHGLDQDASAFSVFDVTTVPYKQVAKYHNATLPPLLLPTILANIGLTYNKAFILVELNDVGSQVADSLHHDLEYENIFRTEGFQRQGAKVSAGFKRRVLMGLRMTEPVKRIGCSNLKTLIEREKLLIHDFETISELSTFTQQGNTYKADEGYHDDLVMTLVLFGWLASQKYFREEHNTDIRQTLEKENENTDWLSFGFQSDDPVIEEEGGIVDNTLWLPVGKTVYDVIREKFQNL